MNVKKTGLKEKIAGLGIAFALICAFLPINYANADDGNVYSAYDSSKQRQVVDQGGVTDSEWSLCMNSNRTSPGTSDSATGSYTKIENATESAHTDNGGTGDFQKIKRLLYYRLKNPDLNYAVFQNEYYYLEGNTKYDTNWGAGTELDKQQKALRAFENDSSNDDEIEKSMEVIIYHSSSSRVQNLISARLLDKSYENPKGEIHTAVKADGVTGTEEKAAESSAESAQKGITVVDTIQYSGLVSGEKYDVTGELFEVKDGQVTGEAKSKATMTFTASGSTGEWELDFGKVTGLEAGKTYVVYETAISENDLVDSDQDGRPDKKHEVTHKNPADKAQTIVIDQGKPDSDDILFSKVNIGGKEIEGAKIEIRQGDAVVAEWTSEADRSHTVKLTEGEYVFHEKSAPEGYLKVTDISFSVNKDGTVTVSDADGNKVRADENKLTVTDKSAQPGAPKKSDTPRSVNPVTGDANGILITTGILLLSILALILTIRKKANR